MKKICSVLFLGIFIVICSGCSDKNDASKILNEYKEKIKQCNEKLQKKDGIYFFEDTVCFNGQISKKSVAYLFALNWDKISYFVVDSGGGEVEAALDVADTILKNKIAIIINGSCLSSCANYWFTSAYWKIVPDGSLVGWHGGPGGRLASTETDEKILSYLDNTKARSDAFFKKINVDIKLISERPEWVGENGSNELRFWSYKQVDIEKFGVNNIIYMWFPSDNYKF